MIFKIIFIISILSTHHFVKADTASLLSIGSKLAGTSISSLESFDTFSRETRKQLADFFREVRQHVNDAAFSRSLTDQLKSIKAETARLVFKESLSRWKLTALKQIDSMEKHFQDSVDTYFKPLSNPYITSIGSLPPMSSLPSISQLPPISSIPSINQIIPGIPFS